MALRRLMFYLLLFWVLPLASFGQQTVFDVPSADVLDRGKVYGELDLTFRPVDFAFGATPRVVFGVGHRIEAGLNVNGIGAPGESHTILSPTLKWKLYDGGKNGWAFLAGDDLFFPVQNRMYNTGNYFYAFFSKSWETGTRAGFGGYHFSPNVVARAQRAGGQFTFEQNVLSKLQMAAEWYTGRHANGYFNPGLIYKATPRFTFYGTY